MIERTRGDEAAGGRVSVVPRLRSALGESPLWLAAAGRLAFVDMVGGRVHRVDLETGDDEAIDTAGYVGAVVETASGSLACVTVDGVAIVRDGALIPAVRVLHDDTTRLNDAACDPWGRLWVGSTSRTDEAGAGAMHVWAPGTSPTTVLSGLTQPNGIGWSPDGSRVYAVDTGTAEVLSAPIDPATGDVGGFETFLTLEGSLPDGLAVAADGDLWIAMWDGGRIDRFSPSGALEESVPLPVSRPTSCAFTGDGRLAVTTARYGLDLDDAAIDGAVLTVDACGAGAPVGKLAA